MNRRIITTLAAGALAVGLSAWAQTTPQPSDQPATPEPSTAPPAQPSTPENSAIPSTEEGSEAQKVSGQAVDPMMGKHLALLNVYLENAILNAKALSSLSDMNVPTGEKNVKELTKNLDMSIKGAISHIGPLEKMNDPKMTRLQDLNQSLKEAKATIAKLKKAKNADFDAQVDQVGASLSSSQQIFRDVAKTANFTVLEDVNLQTVPVKGVHDSDMEDMDRMPREPKEITPPKDEQKLPQPAQPTSPPSDTPQQY